ncbi:MAG: MBL fold metallo-hydrolase [Hyphomicrobiales bacterium]|nr:MBL fold metallo-hydrolase [Hyphomicrobiales bacterium]
MIMARNRTHPIKFLATALLVAVVSVFSGATIISADEEDEDYEIYYRGHLSRLARDAYRRGQSLPERLIVPRDEAEARLHSSASASATWIGHSSFFLRMGGLGILTDPVFSSHASPAPPLGPRRTQRPGVAFARLPRVHVIILSHGHYDHSDFPTLRRLAERDRRTVVLVPKAMKPLLQKAGFSKILEHSPGRTTRVGKVRFTSIRAAHHSGRTYHGNEHPYALSWLIEAPGLDLLFAGDTAYTPEFRQLRRRRGPVDVALVPIGAYSPRAYEKRNHVNPEEAIRIAREVGARTAIAMHWGTFMLTPEPILEPTERFRKAGKGPLRVIVPKIGETIPLKR